LNVSYTADNEKQILLNIKGVSMKIRSILLIVLAMFFLACPAVVDAATYTNRDQGDETYDCVWQNK
jgi:hypothetical protein